jgi:hypothetical protein
MANSKGHNHGGVRKGQGRPSKADELKVIEAMDAVMVPEDLWKALAKQVKKGDTQAIKLWASYRIGLPKQMIHLEAPGVKTINALFVNNPIKLIDDV